MQTRTDWLAVVRNAHIVIRNWRRAVDRVGLTPGRAAVLLAISRADRPPKNNEIATATGASAATVSGVLFELTRAGLVEQLSDPFDRRTRRCILTKSGNTVVQRLQEALTGEEPRA